MMRFAAATIAVAALIGCGAQPLPAPPATATLVEREAILMGTRARLATYHPSRESGLHALEQALGILEHTEAELSTWRDDSAISLLNRQPIGDAFALSDATCRMFRVVYETVLATGGTFDPGLGALTAAWDIHGGGREPDERSLAAARERSGLRLMRFDAARCTVTRDADATIDVGAFGKGEALDRVAASGLRGPWMIDLGGQVSASGGPPGERGWQISIAHPYNREQRLFDVVLREGSLSTSGGSERDLVANGRRIAHHIDPRNGRPAPFNGSVVVWHRSGLEADMLSTALYVMGPVAGMRWAAEQELAVCYLTPQPDGVVRVVATPEFETLRAP
jgi:FAD:protein FMN transferase